MSGYLRNVIAAARRPGAALKPLVPSLYADPGVRDQDARPEPLVDDTVPPRGVLEPPSAPTSSHGPAQPDRDAHGFQALFGEARNVSGDTAAPALISQQAPSWVRALLQPSVARDPAHAPAPHLSTATHDAEQLTPNPTASAPTVADAPNPTAVSQARIARPALERDSPATAEGIDGSSAARSRVAPLLREQSVASEAHDRSAAPSPRTSAFENRSVRPGAGASHPQRNDVEIHIGRIEVTAATPIVRAPPQSKHVSPSLSDYLNGRRGRRT